MLANLYTIAGHLFTNLSVALALVSFFSRTQIFKRIMTKLETSIPEKGFLAVLFGALSILATYHGLPIGGAIANTRAIGVIVGGLIGGPVVGGGAGLIAAIHRLYLGGFTVYASSCSTLAEGLLAGLFYYRTRNKKERWLHALIIAFMLETLHMIILLLVPGPFEQSAKLVMQIGPPMMIINPIGVAAFVALLETVYQEQAKIEATAAQLALQIANKTMAYMRKGLNRYSAGNTANIILDMVESVSSVAITSRDRVLAFVGTGIDHHYPDSNTGILTRSTKRVLDKGEFAVAQTKREIGCPAPGCPLASKVVVPLTENQVVVGSLVLYKTTENSITSFETELALGLGQLISTQIEIRRSNQQAEQLARAEVQVLQAQVNPHFLFNALNTIAFYCRKEPETARELLVNLGDYYRSNLTRLDSMINLETEIRHVDSYVQIEMARFSGRLQVLYRLTPESKGIMVPPLILQPIVENAIKHGILPRNEGGVVQISGSIENDSLILVIEDDGVGMDEIKLRSVLDYNPNRNNIGLSNVHNRIKSIYGSNYGLKIESEPDKGSRVTIPIPIERNGGDSAKDITG